MNRLRSDIKQGPAKKNKDGTIANKAGSAIFLYSDKSFELGAFQASKYLEGWDFETFDETKILFLTHRLSAVRLGFAEFISKTLADIESDIETGTIADMIECFDKTKLLRKGDGFEIYVEKYGEIYDKVRILPSIQLMSYFSYYNSYSPYSTQHGIKGAEFENVLVVMDNGRWNNYNFKYFFEQTPGKESVIERTERIFYVCCSRAKNNLIVYYPNPTNSVLEIAKELFGAENVKKM